MRERAVFVLLSVFVGLAPAGSRPVSVASRARAEVLRLVPALAVTDPIVAEPAGSGLFGERPTTMAGSVACAAVDGAVIRPPCILVPSVNPAAVPVVGKAAPKVDDVPPLPPPPGLTICVAAVPARTSTRSPASTRRARQ